MVAGALNVAVNIGEGHVFENPTNQGHLEIEFIDDIAAWKDSPIASVPRIREELVTSRDNLGPVL